MNDFTEQIGVIKSRGQVYGREESHYHEREGGIVRRFWGIKSSRRGEFQASCQTECVELGGLLFAFLVFLFLLLLLVLTRLLIPLLCVFSSRLSTAFRFLSPKIRSSSILRLQDAMSLTPSAASSHDLMDNTNISRRDSMTRRNGKTLFTSSGELAYT